MLSFCAKSESALKFLLAKCQSAQSSQKIGIRSSLALSATRPHAGPRPESSIQTATSYYLRSSRGQCQCSPCTLHFFCSQTQYRSILYLLYFASPSSWKTTIRQKQAHLVPERTWRTLSKTRVSWRVLPASRFRWWPAKSSQLYT